MKRFLLILILPILLSAQPASRISRQDTLRAYLADTIYVKNRFRVSAIARFDSTVTIKGFQVDSSTLATKGTTQVLTGTKYIAPRWYFNSVGVDTISSRSSGKITTISDSINVGGYIYNNGRIVYRKIPAGAMSPSVTYGSSVAFGDSALSKVTGAENTAGGVGSLYNNTTGSRNTSFGSSTLQTNVSGRYLSAFGFGALGNFNVDSANSAFGYKAGLGYLLGSYNTNVGFHAVQYGDSGKSNVVVGANTGRSMYNSDSTTAIGAQSLYYTRNMRGVTALGFGAGYVNGTTNDTNGTYNTWLGMFASPSPSITGLSKSVGIGYNSKVGASNTIALGGVGSDTVRVTIGGTTVPYQSAIAGGSAYQPYLRIEGGTYTNGTIGGLALNVSNASKFGSTIDVSGAIGANSANGITTTQTTFPIVNSTATTINFGGAASAINVGADSVNLLLNGLLLLQNRMITAQNKDNPAIYSTSSTGSAAPFTANGNLVIQARKSAARDIYFLSNSGTIAILRDGTGGLTLGTTAGTGSYPLYSGTITSTRMSTLDTLTTSHIKGKTSAPTIAAGTGAGTSPSVSIVTNSTDLAGEILVRTGTTPTANGDIATVTFNKKYTRPPQVVLTPSTGLAAAHAALVYIKSTSGSTFVVTDTVTALTASQVYRWKYHVIE